MPRQHWIALPAQQCYPVRRRRRDTPTMDVQGRGLNTTIKHHQDQGAEARAAHDADAVSGALNTILCLVKKSKNSWCLDIKGLTVKDLRAFLEHINFLSSRARNDDFKDWAQVDYDKDIQKLAEVDGFTTFGSKNTGISMFHYGTQNMRHKKTNIGLLFTHTMAWVNL